MHSLAGYHYISIASHTEVGSLAFRKTLHRWQIHIAIPSKTPPEYKQTRALLHKTHIHIR